MIGQLPKDEWIDSAYDELCRRLGEPNNNDDRDHLRAWASALADIELGYFEEGLSPAEAVQEDLSC